MPPQPKNEPPRNTTFTITPAKPKGTVAQALAGELPPPPTQNERVKRRVVAPKGERHVVGGVEVMQVPPQAVDNDVDRVDQASSTRHIPAHELVLADLRLKREEIDAAIRALEALYP